MHDPFALVVTFTRIQVLYLGETTYWIYPGRATR
jgi:hypothetical protein